MKGKKVLVTGGTGFIGNYVVEELLKRGFEVIATSRKGFREVEKFNQNSKVRYIPLDLEDLNQNFFELFEEPDLMIHLAWEGVSDLKSLIHIDKNLFGSYFFIKNIIENGLKDLVVLGTCLEYGMKEGCLNEKMNPEPSIPYSIAKDSLRKFIEELKKKNNFHFKWIRLFYTYGKGQNPNSIISQLDAALERGEKVFNMSGGEQVRDYLPVEKVAEYIVKIANQNKTEGIINCCSGKPISIKDLVNEHLRKNNKNIKLNLGYYSYPDYEPFKFWGDTKKLESVLNI